MCVFMLLSNACILVCACAVEARRVCQLPYVGAGKMYSSPPEEKQMFSLLASPRSLFHLKAVSFC